MVILKQIITTAMLIVLAVSTARADIAREVQSGESGGGSFAEVGIQLLTGRVPLIGFTDSEDDSPTDVFVGLDLSLQGRLAYKGFFAEIIQESFSDITFGYTIRNDERIGLDVIATQSFNAVERSIYPDYVTITDREDDLNLGLRANLYNGGNIFQFELVGDISDAHRGIMAAAQYGRQFQYRNWNLHALVGSRYFSEKVIDHYFGVSEAESTEKINPYNAGHGFLPTFQAGATLPLSEKWVFRTGFEYSYLPESVRNSPLAQGDDIVVVQAGFYRVFYPR